MAARCTIGVIVWRPSLLDRRPWTARAFLGFSMMQLFDGQ